MTIIKEDKGNAIVILNKAYYRTKIQEIIRDETNDKLINTSRDNH